MLKSNQLKKATNLNGLNAGALKRLIKVKKRTNSNGLKAGAEMIAFD